jgi:K+-sensing histidine kinase KdpD
MVRAARTYVRDPLPLVTLGAAGILGETIIRTTGSGVGVGAIFLLSIIYIAEERGRKVGICAALFFALFNNFAVIGPRDAFSIPSLNELVLYGCGFAAAFVGDRLGVRNAAARTQALADRRHEDKVAAALYRIAALDREVETASLDVDEAQLELAALCGLLVRESGGFERLEDLRPLMMVLDHLDRTCPGGVCVDEDASKLLRAAIATYMRVT